MTTEVAGPSVTAIPLTQRYSLADLRIFSADEPRPFPAADRSAGLDAAGAAMTTEPAPGGRGPLAEIERVWGRGGMGLLVSSSDRERPVAIGDGEVPGPEALPMLLAITTEPDGSPATI